VPKGFPSNQNFSRGLQTKAVEDGLPLPDFTTFANVRVSDGSAAARTGRVGLSRAGTTTYALDFVAASSQYLAAEIDPRVWTLGTEFTLEILVSLDDKTLNNTVLYAGHTTPSIVVDTSSNKWRVRFWDSAATLDTITTTADALETTQSLQITRSGSTLTLRVDNDVETTATLDASLLSRTPVGDLRVGRGASTDYLDGDLDYIRMFSNARSAHADRLMRFPDSRSSVCLANYGMELSASGGYVVDDSRYENTLEPFSTPTATAALAHQSPGVDGIFPYRDADNKKQVIVANGGSIYHAEV